MGSEANRTAKKSPESPSLGLNQLITKLKSSMASLDTQNVTKTLLGSEQRLKTQNLELIRNTQVLEKENKKLSDLLKKKDRKIGNLQRENEELEDDVKDVMEENQGLKKMVEDLKKANGEYLKKVRAYEKMVLNYDVRVSSLEKMGKELMDSADFSDKQKNHVLENSTQQMSKEKGESVKGTDEKLQDTIQIDDDDENDQKHVPSSKRHQGSSEIEREHDSDDERCISTLIKKPVTKEIRRECHNDNANKIPTVTTTSRPEILTGVQQIASHFVSPFLDSSPDEERFKEACETTLDKQRVRQETADMRIESEISRKQMANEKGKSQERTNNGFPDIIQIDEDEDKYEYDQKDVSFLKRKWSSSNVKVEDATEDERCTSILRRKSVSKELKSECKNDHVNDILTGGHPLTSNSASPFFVSGSNEVTVKESYVPVIKRHTERWETEAEMIIEFSRNDELCMNAVCALHRQNIYVGAYLLPRVNRLAERLIDGDTERKLKKTPWDLDRFELDQCRMLAATYSAELYKVYQENADRFFPPRS